MNEGTTGTVFSPPGCGLSVSYLFPWRSGRPAFMR